MTLLSETPCAESVRLLRYDEGLSWKEVAQRLGITKKAARKLLDPYKGELGRSSAKEESACDTPWQVSHARAEARVFVHLVQTGQMTKEEAEADIGVEPCVRAFLQRTAQESGGSLAKTIQNALRLRDAILLEFRRVCRKAA